MRIVASGVVTFGPAAGILSISQVVTLIILGGITWRMHNTTTALTKRIESSHALNAQYNDLIEKKENLLAQEKLFSSFLKRVATLNKKRSAPHTLLKNLHAALPESLDITQLSITPKSLSLVGSARDHTSLDHAYQRLTECKEMATITITTLSANTESPGLSFTMNGSIVQ